MAAVPTFEPVRAQWLGRRTSSPAAAILQDGDWWYRTDLGIFCYWDGTAVHCWGSMGGMLFSGNNTIVCATAGDYVINVTLSSPWAPTTINHIIEVYFQANPTVDPGTMVNPVITAPVVGFTLIGVGAGTTLTANVRVTGW